PVDERVEYLDRAQKEIERISTIIHQLLEISRPSHGGLQTVSVHALLDDMAQVLKVQPFMSHVLEALSALDVKDIYLLVGWKANKIKEYYGDGSRLGLRIKYLEQRERMGTAHAIGCADGSINEPFVCVNGDVIVFQDDIKAMIEKHRTTGGHVMGTVSVEHPERFGVALKPLPAGAFARNDVGFTDPAGVDHDALGIGLAVVLSDPA
ncbi:MAG: hypothetical protein HGA87_06580, partial [Desulfobulbaceae bacterium]|nr:hypothetical protein [Desulfobulbaceae bacterium]